MHLTFSPQAGLPGQAETTLHVAGDVLTIDGVPHDLSPVPEGGEGEWEDSPIAGAIRRIDGVLHATVRVVLGDDAASFQPTDPAHWMVPAAHGAVAIPTLRMSTEQEA
ncbi:MAG: hypothetical protein ACXIVG_08330 [Pararhodobacter sp.]